MSLPGADVLTPSAMVFLQDRAVVSFTSWLADGLRVCGQTGRGLQIVTPPESRLTMPLRLVLTAPNSRWVVRAGAGHYDGLTGVPLRWDGASFATDPAATAYAPTFTTPPGRPLGAQLTLTLRARHRPEGAPGAAMDQVCRALTGGPPGGWGTAEPVTWPWRVSEPADLFRSQGSQPLWLTVVGSDVDPAAVGTMLLSAVGNGVEEAVTLAVGYADPNGVPLATLPTLAGALATEYSLLSFFAQLSPGFPDLTTGPRWVGPAAPVGMAVSGAAAGPPGIEVQPIGDEGSPTAWYVLGDGRDQEGWRRYEQLTGYLQARAG